MVSVYCSAQPTIGLLEYDNSTTDGYVLFTGVSSKQTYLIDKCGLKIKEWTSNYRPGLSVELLPTGELFRTGLSSSSSFGTGGGKGGILELFDWNGNLTWSYQISDANQCQHHDAIVLPNGNVLAIVWDRKTELEANQAGKDPAITAVLVNQEVWSEKIVEIQPSGSNGGTIIWEWKAWDHMVQDMDNSKDNFGIVNQSPELINVNYVLQGPPTNPDWLHINSLDYNPVTDEIVLSNHNFGEVWIIDHSTTTAQASSHADGNSGKGGDLLYRWGNPVTYDRGAAGDQKLFKQHHATFIKPGFPNAGKILVFNNGVNRPNGNYSSVDIIDVSVAGYPYTIGANSPYLPTSEFWTYQAPNPTSFYAPNISGVFPLENGSFLVTDGPQGRIFEIDSMATMNWEYVNPTDNVGPMSQGATPALNTVFRGAFYDPSYPAFVGQSLLPMAEIEINPIIPSLCTIAQVDEICVSKVEIFPNPIKNEAVLTVKRPVKGPFSVSLMNGVGKMCFEQQFTELGGSITVQFPKLFPGVYYLMLENTDFSEMKKIIIE